MGRARSTANSASQHAVGCQPPCPSGSIRPNARRRSISAGSGPTHARGQNGCAASPSRAVMTLLPSGEGGPGLGGIGQGPWGDTVPALRRQERRYQGPWGRTPVGTGKGRLEVRGRSGWRGRGLPAPPGQRRRARSRPSACRMGFARSLWPRPRRPRADNEGPGMPATTARAQVRPSER